MATDGHDLSSYDIHSLPKSPKAKIGVVVAEWNEEITSGLLRGVEEVLQKSQSVDGLRDYTVHYVPGSFELPMGAQWLLSHQDVDAVICVGSVIRGETAHFDYVCQACSQGVMDVSLKYDRPVLFCVLTDDTIEQSRARSGGVHGNKGIEAAVASLKMVALKRSLD